MPLFCEPREVFKVPRIASHHSSPDASVSCLSFLATPVHLCSVTPVKLCFLTSWQGLRSRIASFILADLHVTGIVVLMSLGFC